MLGCWASVFRAGSFLLLLLVRPSAVAQLNTEHRDHLRQVLARTKDPRARLHPLKELAWSYLFSDEARPYLNELDSLTELIATDTDPMVRRSALGFRSCMFYQRGYLHKFQRDMVSAQRDFREAIRTGREAFDTLNTANGLSALGVSYLALDMPLLALRYFDEELELILATTEKAPMYLSDIRLHRAEALMRAGRYAEARGALQQCDTTAFDRHASTLMGFARLLAAEGDTTGALLQMERAQRVARRSEQRWDLLNVLQQLGSMQLRARYYPDAISTTSEAIALARTIGDHAALAGCLVIAGRAEMGSGHNKAAEDHLLEAMELAEQHGLVGVARESGDEGGMVHAAAALKDLYKLQGRMEEALSISEVWTEWKDSLYRIEGREDLLRFELEHAALVDSMVDAERLASATSELQDQVRVERSSRLRVLVIGGGALALAAILLVVLVARRRRERLLTEHASVRSRNEQMIRDLKQRERMSEDLHEELGAGLSALKLWTELDLSEEVDPRRQKILRDRISMIGDLIVSLRQIIWAMNSPNGSVKNLVDHLNDSAHLFCAQHGLRLRAVVEDGWPPVLLGADQRRLLYLILKEALANIVKHSGADTVDLHMRWADGLCLELQDNGSGAPQRLEGLPGNGLRNMQRRAASLGGTVRFVIVGGVRVEVYVPLVPEG